MKTVFVLCQNDYPYAVFELEADAESEKKVKNEADELKKAHGVPGQRIYYHIKEVPMIRRAA